jgi:pilus assembly protein Flp/PilA
MRLLRSLLRHDEGATAIEYGLIAAMISVVLIAGVGGLAGGLENVFSTVENHLADVAD